MRTAYKIVGVVNGLFFVVAVVLFVWAAFDFKRMKDYALLSQVPLLLCMGIRKVLKP